jgi:hypothetical protein
VCVKHSPPYGLRDDSALGLSTLSYRTRLGPVPSVRFLCVGQTSTSFSAFTLSTNFRGTTVASPHRRSAVPTYPPHGLDVSTRHAAEGLATTRHPVLNLSRSSLPIQVIGPIPHPPHPGKPLQAHHQPSHSAHPQPAHHGQASTGSPRTFSLRASQSLSTTWPRFASSFIKTVFYFGTTNFGNALSLVRCAHTPTSDKPSTGPSPQPSSSRSSQPWSAVC